MNRRSFMMSAGAALSAGFASSAGAQVFPPEPIPLGPAPSSVRKSALPGNWFTDMPRASFGQVKIQDEVYILGGHTGLYHCYLPELFTNQFLSYNLKTKQWKKLTEYPFPVQSPNLIATPSGILAFGGYRYEPAFHFVGCALDARRNTEQSNDTYSGRSDDKVYYFDFRSEKWEFYGEIPHRRSSGAAILADGKVFLVSGWDGTPLQRKDRIGRYHPSVDVFDLQSKKFIPFDKSISSPNRRASSGIAMNGTLVLVGGLDDSPRPAPIRNVTIFDPKNGQFSELTPLDEPRFAPGACFTGKHLVVAGGLDFTIRPPLSPLLKSIVVYDPQTAKWKKNSVELSVPSMFVDLVAVDEETVLALSSFPGEQPVALMEEIKIG